MTVEVGQFGPIEWAAAARPLSSEEACGDQSAAIDVSGNAVLFGVLDGAGHGSHAARAAACGLEVLRQDPARPLGVLVQLCHRAMVDTRGGAVTLARIDFEADLLTWTGIGNVAAHLLAKAPTGVALRSSTSLGGGIVGYRLPETIHIQTISIRPGDLLVMTTDGVSDDYVDSVDSVDFAASAGVIAERILSRHRKGTDDALVLTARRRGVSS
jgi:negative regulator of sigma-B (phosphoserine phosphatase)